MKSEKEIIAPWNGRTEPLVSVICATYNHEEFIRDAIDGFLEQITEFPFEIIIHDDASTDATINIVREYIEKYPKIIRVIFQKENQYSKGQKIISIVLPDAMGKYIALCEGDDYWTNHSKLQTQVDFLESNPKFSICFHESVVLYEGKRTERFNKLKKNTVFTITDLTQKNFISTASCVFRKNYTKLPEWHQKLKAGDWGLHMYNAKFGKIYYMPDCMSVYRKHDKGVWSNLSNEEMILSGVEIMKALDIAFEYKFHKEFEKGIIDRLKALSKEKKAKSYNIEHIPFIPKNLDRYIVHKAIFKALKKSMPLLCGKLLDVGCGKMPYKEYICKNSDTEHYIGLDIEGGLVYDPDLRPDYTWDGANMPFADAFFDCAIATEVFEHCPDPEAVMSEIYRVLKPGGALFCTVPFLWPLHEVPHDEYRYTPFSFKRHLASSGFVDIELKPLGGWDASLAQMLALWVRRRSMGKWKRSSLTRLFMPAIYFLSQRDKRSLTQFHESTMIIGLSGTARKPKGNAHPVD